MKTQPQAVVKIRLSESVTNAVRWARFSRFTAAGFRVHGTLEVGQQRNEHCKLNVRHFTVEELQYDLKFGRRFKLSKPLVVRAEGEDDFYHVTLNPDATKPDTCHCKAFLRAKTLCCHAEAMRSLHTAGALPAHRDMPEFGHLRTGRLVAV